MDPDPFFSSADPGSASKKWILSTGPGSIYGVKSSAQDPSYYYADPGTAIIRIDPDQGLNISLFSTIFQFFNDNLNYSVIRKQSFIKH